MADYRSQFRVTAGVDVTWLPAEERHVLLDSQIPRRAAGPGENGEPSNSTTVAPTASAPTSQFHIIQPQVVK